MNRSLMWFLYERSRREWDSQAQREDEYKQTAVLGTVGCFKKKEQLDDHSYHRVH